MQHSAMGSFSQIFTRVSEKLICCIFHVPCSSTGVDNKKVGVDNEKALELTNSTVFHRGRQQKSSRAGQQNNFFIFQYDFNIEILPKNATKHPVA